MSELNPQSRPQEETVRLLEAAIAEFKRAGSVRETRCNRCDGVISVERVGDDAYKVGCPCGKFWGSIRGL